VRDLFRNDGAGDSLSPNGGVRWPEWAHIDPSVTR
jgi:hypothetical protein